MYLMSSAHHQTRLKKFCTLEAEPFTPKAYVI